MAEDKQLTFKQRKWMKEYLKTGNATEAAMQVYDCKDRKSAAVVGFENLRKLNYEDLLEQAGITDKKLIDTLVDGLEAGTITTIDDAKELIPDYRTRHKYMETALKLKKRLIERKDVTSGGKSISGAKEMTEKFNEIMNEPEKEESG